MREGGSMILRNGSLFVFFGFSIKVLSNILI